MNQYERDLAEKYGATISGNSFLLNGYSICSSIYINNKTLQYSVSRIDELGFSNTTYHKTLVGAFGYAKSSLVAVEQ